MIIKKEGITYEFLLFSVLWQALYVQFYHEVYFQILLKNYFHSHIECL